MELTPNDVQKLLQKPTNFSSAEDWSCWCLAVILQTRDSQENARVRATINALKASKRFKEDVDWRVVRFSHWLHGWEDVLAFRVQTDDVPAEVTAIAEWICERLKFNPEGAARGF